MSEVALPAPVVMSLPRRIIGVFVSPRQVFEYLRERPRLLGALVVLIVVTLIAVFPILDLMVQDQRAAMNDKGTMTEEQITKAEQAMRVTTPIFAALGNAFIVFVLAAIYLFIANILLGGSTTYKHLLAGVAHIAMINIPAAIIRVPIMLAKGSSEVTLSPAAFLPLEQEKTFLYYLLSQFDIFYLWMIGLSAVAISVLASVPTRKAVTAVVIMWAVLAPVFALLGSKFGPGAGG